MPKPTVIALLALSFAATSVAHAAGAPREHDADSSPLVPEGHAEEMADHAVAVPEIVFDPGKGLVFESVDGDFALTLGVRAQLLYTLERDGKALPADEEATRHSFEVRRARLKFRGHVFGAHNKYKLGLGFSPSDMGVKNGVVRLTPLLEWSVTFDYLRDFSVKAGQYKVPYNRQRLISSGSLELVDRSLAEREMNLARDIGVQAMSLDFLGLGHLRYYAGVFLGAGRDARELRPLDMMVLGRLEVLPFGGADESWDHKEADFARRLTPRLSLGVAYAYLDDAANDRGIAGSAPIDGGTTDMHNVTADFFFKAAGVSLSGEFYWRHGARTFGDATTIDEAGDEVLLPRVPPRNGVGYYLQLGYLIPNLPLQIVGRHAHLIGLGDGTETSLPDGDELGGGVSWYFAEHPLKLQADYFRIRRDSYDATTERFEQQSWAESADRLRVQLQVAY